MAPSPQLLVAAAAIPSIDPSIAIPDSVSLLLLLLLAQSNIFSQPEFHGHQKSSSSTNSFPRAIKEFFWQFLLFKGEEYFPSEMGCLQFTLFLLCFFAFFSQCRSQEDQAKVVGGNEPEQQLPYKQYVSEQNYHVPFKTRISEPFKEYQTVHAVGKTKVHPKRVDLNFHKGGNDDDEMPLHLSARFDEGLFAGKLVFNTFANQNWSAPEERVQSPFKADSEFDIRVRILPGKFQVFGNRVEVGTFDQRMPLFGVNHVSLLGDLDSLRVFHYGGTLFPNPYNAIAKLLPGKRLDLSALPTGNRVNFNLYKRNNQDIALHISFRYNDGLIIRNAMNGLTWGAEESDGGFPLAKNELFDLTIINEPAHFLIILNGKKYATFAHRTTNMDIETLEVDGTVELHTVTINDAR